MAKTGKIKISSENMMPIIKKWLYSDKDIFLREIVANGVDAITKHKKLVDMGEAANLGKEYRINVYVDEKAKTLTVEDNGLGMTADEVEKYITQIAFSGAEDFLHKYQNLVREQDRNNPKYDYFGKGWDRRTNAYHVSY